MVLKSEQNLREQGILFDLVNLQLVGSDGEQVVLIQDFKANGKGYDDALKNASQLNYNYTVVDSVITLDRNLDLSQLDKFRGQNLKLSLEIPYDKAFILDKSILPILRNTLNKNGYRSRDVNSRNFWVFNEDGLLCLTCKQNEEISEADSLSKTKFSDAFFMK
jgi:hypothetical protein